MQIRALERADIPALYAIYLRSTERAAHCRFAPSEERFAAMITQPAREGAELFVAADGAARGFGALDQMSAEQHGADTAAITALFFDGAEAGQALIDAGVERARARGARRLLAFPPEHGYCPVLSYNAGWDGLSDTMDLAARLLCRSGFGPFFRELHLECAGEDFPPPLSPAPGGDIAIESPEVRPPSFRLVATHAGEQVGDCWYSTLERRSDDPRAARWGYVGWLWAGESVRRRGLARHLLTRALRHLRELGCEGCWLTTTSDNWAAQPLYLSSGFRIVDASASFRRDL